METERERERERDRLTDRRTDRQRETERDRDRNRQTDRQTDLFYNSAVFCVPAEVLVICTERTKNLVAANDINVGEDIPMTYFYVNLTQTHSLPPHYF